MEQKGTTVAARAGFAAIEELAGPTGKGRLEIRISYVGGRVVEG